jgi:hypothetical protein
MSIPGHYNEVVFIGDVREVYTDGSGAAIGVILMVDADAPCEVPIMFPAARPGVSVGDRLWVRGRLAFEPLRWRRYVEDRLRPSPAILPSCLRLEQTRPCCQVFP